MIDNNLKKTNANAKAKIKKVVKITDYSPKKKVKTNKTKISNKSSILNPISNGDNVIRAENPILSIRNAVLRYRTLSNTFYNDFAPKKANLQAEIKKFSSLIKLFDKDSLLESEIVFRNLKMIFNLYVEIFNSLNYLNEFNNFLYEDISKFNLENTFFNPFELFDTSIKSFISTLNLVGEPVLLKYLESSYTDKNLKDLNSKIQYLLNTKSLFRNADTEYCSNLFFSVNSSLMHINYFLENPSSLYYNDKELNLNYLSYLLSSSDSSIRKELIENKFEKILDNYEYNDSLVNYIELYQNKNDLSETLGFLNYIEEYCQENYLNYSNIFKICPIIYSNLNINNEYIAIRKKCFWVKNISLYDLHYPIFFVNSDYYNELTFNSKADFLNYFKKCFKILGDKYVSLLDNSLIKSSSSLISYNNINDDNIISTINFKDSVFTFSQALFFISNYSNKYNYLYYNENQVIFASKIFYHIVDLIAYFYRLNNSSSTQGKLYFLSVLLEKYQNSLFNEAMFLEIPLNVFTKVIPNKKYNFSPEDITDVYCDMLTKYNENCTVPESYKKTWCLSSTFSEPLSSYQNILSFVCANHIVKRLVKDSKENKKEFSNLLFNALQECNYISPSDVLKKLDISIDFNNPSFLIEEALEDFRALIIKFKEYSKN